MIPTANDFERKLTELLSNAESKGHQHLIVVSGDLHSLVGGYPAQDGNHRMPLCCEVMRRFMGSNDEILYETPSGQSSTLKIKYSLPR